MYCSGCDADHPVTLFSKAQREKRSGLLVPTRECIGLEGHVRLCDHKAITWREISSATNEAAGNVADVVEETVLVSRCGDKYHLPWHGSRFNRTDSQPSVSLVGIPTSNGDSATGSTVAVIKWTAHLALPTSSEEGTSLPPAVMDQILRDMRKGTAAEDVAPELAPGRLPEMNCFDPHLCSCLDYPGMEHLPYTWKYSLRMNWGATAVARTAPTSHPYRSRTDLIELGKPSPTLPSRVGTILKSPSSAQSPTAAPTAPTASRSPCTGAPRRTTGACRCTTPAASTSSRPAAQAARRNPGTSA
ncbi:hypothetical protein GE09DRAFT_591178 [Coniochaeta sp. 2T2.1]|nr:hypothetical protein GE09DRAFT_591178 [Coniochaeta sp. 2T2.1]